MSIDLNNTSCGSLYFRTTLCLGAGAACLYGIKKVYDFARHKFDERIIQGDMNRYQRENYLLQVEIVSLTFALPIISKIIEIASNCINSCFLEPRA